MRSAWCRRLARVCRAGAGGQSSGGSEGDSTAVRRLQTSRCFFGQVIFVHARASPALTHPENQPTVRNVALSTLRRISSHPSRPCGLRFA